VVYTFVCEIEAEDNRKMDKSTVIPFASRTAQDIIENLEKSLEILIVLKEGISSNSATLTTTTTPTNGGEGVKKFESLCRGIVSSVQVHFS
jgi:phosphohistidine swiveling domain-containing protein